MDNDRTSDRLSGRSISCSHQRSGTTKRACVTITPRTPEDTMLPDRRRSFGVLARIRGFPERADEHRHRLRDLVTLIESQLDCHSCESIENGSDATEFTLLQGWSNQKAHDTQLRTEPIQELMPGVKTYVFWPCVKTQERESI